MCRSKHSRLLCLLLSFLLVFASFGLTVSAADDDSNLVNSDLRLWSSSENVDVVKQSSGLFYIRTNGASLNGKYLLVGSVFDVSKVKSGDSFSISFYLPKYEETGFTWTEDKYFSQFNSANGSFFVGLAYLDSQGSPVFYDNYYDELYEEDFRQYAGKEYTYTFTVDKISGTPYVMLAYVGTSSSNVGYVSLGSVSFVNNDEAEEEGFFSRLFEWFGDRFEDLKTTFSLISDTLSILKDYLGEKISGIGDKLSDVWSSIKDGFSDSVQNVTNNFTDLGTDLTGKFDSVGTWFSDLKDSIVSKFQAIGDAITSKLHEVGESITSKFQEIGDKFTEFFDKFKPRVYESFTWVRGWVAESSGRVSYGDNFSNYSVITEAFEVPEGTTYCFDFSKQYASNVYVFKYDLSGNFISRIVAQSADIEKYELESGYKYVFMLRFSSAPEESSLSDISNSEFKLYADEGWINALIHKLQNVIKNLFVPDDATLSDFKDSALLMFEEKLGFLWTCFDFLSSMFDKLQSLFASGALDGTYTFTLPKLEFDMLGYHILLWDDITISLDFLQTTTGLGLLYQVYKASLHFMFISILIMYAQKCYKGFLDSK